MGFFRISVRVSFSVSSGFLLDFVSGFFRVSFGISFRVSLGFRVRFQLKVLFRVSLQFFKGFSSGFI